MTWQRPRNLMRTKRALGCVLPLLLVGVALDAGADISLSPDVTADLSGTTLTDRDVGQDDFAKGKDRQKGIGLRLYCVSDQDIAELAAAIKARGGTLEQEPTDQPWGARDLAVADPDGFKISISSGTGQEG